MSKYNKFFLLFKKDLLTIMRDRRSLFTFIFFSLFFTPLLIKGITGLSLFQQNQLNSQDIKISINDQTSNKVIENMFKSSPGFKIITTKDYLKDLQDSVIDGYIDASTDANLKIHIKYIYDQSSNISTNSLIKIQTIVQAYNASASIDLLKSHNLTQDQLTAVSIESKTVQEVLNKPKQNDFILNLLPYFILIAIFQGGTQFALELTTGEKERNTLATTLSLNVSRTTIGLSKISVVLLLSIFSLVMNIVSLIIAFGGGYGSSSSGGGAQASSSVNISPTNLVQLFIVLLPLTLLVSGLLVLLGTYARNQKEGGMFVLPLMLVAIFVGLSASAFDAHTPILVFAIPIVGQVGLIKLILLNTFIPANALISIIVCMVLFIVALYSCIKMFSREEIIFRK